MRQDLDRKISHQPRLRHPCLALPAHYQQGPVYRLRSLSRIPIGVTSFDLICAAALNDRAFTERQGHFGSAGAVGRLKSPAQRRVLRRLSASAAASGTLRLPLNALRSGRRRRRAHQQDL